MAFAEDLAAFFDVDGFAVMATFTPLGRAPVSAPVIIDMPTDALFDNDVLSDEYSIMYSAANFTTVKAGDTGVIDGIKYAIREIKMLSDGKLKKAKLSKVDA